MTQEQKEEIKIRDGGKCVKCGSVEELTIDHVIPLSRGGYDIKENAITLCRTCNMRKGSMIEWKLWQRVVHAFYIDDILQKFKNDVKGYVVGQLKGHITAQNTVLGHIPGIKSQLDKQEHRLKKLEESSPTVGPSTSEIDKVTIQNQGAIIARLCERIDLLEKYLKIEYFSETVEIKEYRKIKKS